MKFFTFLLLLCAAFVAPTFVVMVIDIVEALCE